MSTSSATALRSFQSSAAQLAEPAMPIAVGVRLAGRDPAILLFSIPQRLSPDLEAADVIALEAN